MNVQITIVVTDVKKMLFSILCQESVTVKSIGDHIFNLLFSARLEKNIYLNEECSSRVKDSDCALSESNFYIRLSK